MSYTTGAIINTDAPVVTLAEVKAWLRVDYDHEDALIESTVTAATEFVGRSIGKRLQVETGLYVVDALPVALKQLPGPYHAVTQIEVFHDGGPTIITADQFTVDLTSPAPCVALKPGVLMPTVSEPGAVIVHTVVGYGDWQIPSEGFPYVFPVVFGSMGEIRAVLHRARGHQTYTANQILSHPLPTALKQAVLLIVAHWFENREAGIVGSISTEVKLSFDSLIHVYRDQLYG